MNLPEDLIALLRQPSPCFLSTVMPDGWYGGRVRVRVFLTIRADKIHQMG